MKRRRKDDIAKGTIWEQAAQEADAAISAAQVAISAAQAAQAAVVGAELIPVEAPQYAQLLHQHHNYKLKPQIK